MEPYGDLLSLVELDGDLYKVWSPRSVLQVEMQGKSHGRKLVSMEFQRVLEGPFTNF